MEAHNHKRELCEALQATRKSAHGQRYCGCQTGNMPSQMRDKPLCGEDERSRLCISFLPALRQRVVLAVHCSLLAFRKMQTDRQIRSDRRKTQVNRCMGTIPPSTPADLAKAARNLSAHGALGLRRPCLTFSPSRETPGRSTIPLPRCRAWHGHARKDACCFPTVQMR